ncbi:MAG: hypothetical protein CMK07_13595 [Ponticaulis sp.]|nr:hypothetical protein [Ponticaulis sp.]|tara:strand:- start:2017 stop:2439 length:423 start_codon:yes stop_codon:yes gene_type:complete
MSTSKAKYRPSLDAETLEYLSNLVTREFATNNHPLALVAIGKLAPFVAKIKAGAIKPSHSTVDKPDMLTQLGSPEEVTSDANSDTISEADCYTLWQEAIASNDFTHVNVEIINKAKNYAYLNDLLTEEQEIEYEKSMQQN